MTNDEALYLDSAREPAPLPCWCCRCGAACEEPGDDTAPVCGACEEDVMLTDTQIDAIASEKPCPACDLEQYGHQPLAAFALGVALGVGFGEVSQITARMCARHRPLWIAAAMHAAVLAQTEE